MSIRTRIYLTIGVSGIFFLLMITSLVFHLMSSTMEEHLHQQFDSDANSRINNLNNTFISLTQQFQSTSKLPMFSSMRYHKLTLNEAALKNDIRQMELHLHDLISNRNELSSVIYINNKASEVFKVDKMGIQTNHSDRSQDKTVKQMLNLKNNDVKITLDIINDEIKNLIWWIPVYVSSDKLDGVISFSINYNFILESTNKLVSSTYEHACINNTESSVLYNTDNNKNCSPYNDKLWRFTESAYLPSLEWKLSLFVNPNAFSSDVDYARMLVFGIIFPIIAIISFITLLFFSNYIVSAILKLVEFARIMGTQQTLSPIVINRNDELGELAKEMNRSAIIIENNRNELEKINRDTIEKSRRNLQAIMDHSPTVIYVKDTDLKYTFINRTFEELFHVSRESVIGKSDYDLFPVEFAESFQKNDKEVIITGKSLEIEESAPHDDTLHSYVSIKFPLVDDEGNIYSICGISTDITHLKHQDEKLRRSQKMDALGKLTGGIAHDYNNMLGVILGYTELLSAEVNSQPNLLKYTKQIKHAGERGAKLTQKLLAFSRKNITDAKNININDVINNNQHMLEKTMTARINLAFDFQSDLWDVHIDINELEDAIINICINSMHAMPEGGKLYFKTQNEVINEEDAKTFDIEAGEYVSLTITDTGCGIEHSDLDKIFDPFYSTKGEHGTGLGLSQVYGFVDKSGGKVKVYSEPDKGTSISLYLPRSHVNLINKYINKSETHSPTTGHETILVVDDESALVDLTQEILSQNGYHVICANGAKQALTILENNSVDLLLSDVIMPEIDGYQLAEIVQQKYPSIKIQLASGFDDDRHNNKANKNLTDKLLHKPFKQSELLDRVREILGNS